jgi:hypothetical protein
MDLKDRTMKGMWRLVTGKAQGDREDLYRIGHHLHEMKVSSEQADKMENEARARVGLKPLSPPKS